MAVEPLKLDAGNAILLTGASGVGKSAAAAAIAGAAPCEAIVMRAQEGLAQLRAGALPQGKLVVMEAEGFHPLNPRARGAFAALAGIDGVDTVGVISAAGDAEDAAEMVAAFRFRRLIVTGLDRTRRLGALAAAATAGARLAHVLKGGALEKFTPDDLAAALLA
jgi:energy-coupling factor transporter ATP-binding protein EcfA2